MSQFQSTFINELNPESLAQINEKKFISTDLEQVQHAANSTKVILFQHKFLKLPNEKILGLTYLYGLSGQGSTILYAQELNGKTGKRDGRYSFINASNHNDFANKVVTPNTPVTLYKNGKMIKEIEGIGFIRKACETFRHYEKHNAYKQSITDIIQNLSQTVIKKVTNVLTV
jgi:hypothetical protein